MSVLMMLILMMRKIRSERISCSSAGETSFWIGTCQNTKNCTLTLHSSEDLLFWSVQTPPLILMFYFNSSYMFSWLIMIYSDHFTWQRMIELNHLLPGLLQLFALLLLLTDVGRKRSTRSVKMQPWHKKIIRSLSSWY